MIVELAPASVYRNRLARERNGAGRRVEHTTKFLTRFFTSAYISLRHA